MARRQVFSGPVSGKQVYPRTTHILPYKLQKGQGQVKIRRMSPAIRQGLWNTASTATYPTPRLFRCLELKKRSMDPDLKEASETQVPTQLTSSYRNEAEDDKLWGRGVQFPWQQAG